MKKLGIDLGTTNTVAAMDDRVLGLQEDGSATLPSVVAYLPNGRVVTGEAARRRRAIDGRNTIFSSKRMHWRAVTVSLPTCLGNAPECTTGTSRG